MHDTSPRPVEGDFRSVFLVRDGTVNFATAFAVIRNDREYFITARHFADSLLKDSIVYFYVQDGWSGQSVRSITRGRGTVDISVFTISQAIQLSAIPRSALVSIDDTFGLVGSDVWSLGFPLGLIDNASDAPYPYPFLTRGSISAVSMNPNEFYFEGVVSPGASGSPVYGIDSNGQLRIIAVVSDLLTESMPEGSSYRAKSGFFRGYSAQYVNLLLNESPPGPAVPSSSQGH